MVGLLIFATYRFIMITPSVSDATTMSADDGDPAAPKIGAIVATRELRQKRAHEMEVVGPELPETQNSDPR